MAWNQTTSAPKKTPTRQGLPSSVKGLLALIVVCALGGLVWWFVSSSPAEKEKKVRKSGEIAEVKPAVKTDAPIASPKVSELPPPANHPLLEGRDTNEWIVVKDPRSGKEYLSRLLKPGLPNRPAPLYKHKALNELDAIIFKDYGDRLPGIVIDDRFAKSFQEAIAERIEISPDDDDATAERKRGMIDTLARLREEIKNGGNLLEIVGSALAERRSIAGLKEQMVTERRNLRDSGASEEEVSDFERACNKILEEKGASPIITKEILSQRIQDMKERRARGE